MFEKLTERKALSNCCTVAWEPEELSVRIPVLGLKLPAMLPNKA